MSAPDFKKPLASKVPFRGGNSALLLWSLVAFFLSGWVCLVLTMHWPGYLAAPAFAVVMLLAPSALLLSGWEIFRYRFTWRGLAALVFSAVATASWVCLVIELIHRGKAP